MAFNFKFAPKAQLVKLPAQAAEDTRCTQEQRADERQKTRKRNIGPVNFGIYFAREGYSVSMPKLMGRNAAGASFKGFSAILRAINFRCSSTHRRMSTHFRRSCRIPSESKELNVIEKINLAKLSEVGGLYIMDGYKEAALERSIADMSGSDWALCGITHTTSSARAMDAIASGSAPVQEWDAVICTSTAVKNNVETVLQAQVNVLKDD